MAKYALGSGLKKAVIITDAKQDYSVGLSKAFKKAYTAGGGEIIKLFLLNLEIKILMSSYSIKQEILIYRILQDTIQRLHF